MTGLANYTEFKNSAAPVAIHVANLRRQVDQEGHPVGDGALL